MSDTQDVLDDHSDYEQIEREAYMSLWDGGQPLLDLCREQDNCRVFVDPISEDEFVMNISGCEGANSHYRITSGDIVDSLEALEAIGFEHFTPEPPQPGEDPLQRVFDAIEEAGRETDD